MTNGTLRGPDFFIVGAPKCATSAMADYLGQHPEIGMASAKESHYFGSDLPERLERKRDLYPHRSPEDKRRHYMEMFTEVQGCKRIGEASVWYLYSHQAAGEIQAFSPDASIIVMLRNPIEMLPSLHSQLVHFGVEPLVDFGEALAHDEERLRNGTPKGFPPHSYRSAVAYAEQLRRYIDVFGSSRVHVVIYDDFAKDTLSAFRATCEFLDVDATFVPDIRVVNSNKQTRSRLLRDVVEEPPERLRVALHAVMPLRARVKVGTALSRINTRFAPREPPPDNTRNVLMPVVEEQVQQLAELNIDVCGWLTPGPA